MAKRDEKQKVTIYTNSMFGMRKAEGKLVDHGTRQWAQYANAPFVHFLPPRARRVREVSGDYKPYILVLAGWGHPDLTNWKPAYRSESGCVVREGKYSMCDPRWNTDADAKLDAYIAESGSAVVADYRHTKGFSSHS